MIPYGRQDITDDDIAAVVEVLKSDFLTQGPAVPEFETKVAQYCGAAHAIATNSATSALHLACLALEIGRGDQVWTSPITFVASANCALYCGAEIDFVDIEPDTFNMSVARLAIMLEQADQIGKLPKAIIPVHMAGQSCDMEGIAQLARRYGVKVIEDASHAVGADYGDHKVGSCRHSDITIFSFHPVKLITTGEGGIALTNDNELARRIQMLRSHGITRDAQLMRKPHAEGWYYEQQMLGYNYRMTDIAGALGSSQISRLDNYVERRRWIADVYNEAFAGLPITLPRRGEKANPSWHLYIIRFDQESAVNRDDAYHRLRWGGIGVNLHYIPVYRQPYYRALGFQANQCPEAEAYYKAALTLPIFPTMTSGETDCVISAVRELFD